MASVGVLLPSLPGPFPPPHFCCLQYAGMVRVDIHMVMANVDKKKQQLMLCVESNNTGWHISVHYVKIFHTYMKCERDGIWGWGIYGLNRWGNL